MHCVPICILSSINTVVSKHKDWLLKRVNCYIMKMNLPRNSFCFCFMIKTLPDDILIFWSTVCIHPCMHFLANIPLIQSCVWWHFVIFFFFQMKKCIDECKAEVATVVLKCMWFKKNVIYEFSKMLMSQIYLKLSPITNNIISANIQNKVIAKTKLVYFSLLYFT